MGVPAKPLPLTGQETGIDVGLKGVRITAEGEAVDTPRHCRKAERELKKAQRRVSRRTEGSTRRRKAVQLLARKHRKVRRQRHDFHHKTALTLVRRYEAIYYEAIYYEAIYYEAIYYEAIYLEDLPVSNLSRRPKAKPAGIGGSEHSGAGAKAGLNTSIQDAGWSSFRQIRACKAACAGTRVEAVPPASTSQDCSGWGGRVEKSLSVRTQVCPSCGLVLDRDENAAKNIQWAGQALRGVPAVAGASNREPVGL